MTLSPDDIRIAARYAMRHYVALSYYGKTPEIMAARGIAQISVCSTFVMQVRDTGFLATAGHVIDEIRKDHEKGIELSDFRLWDGWAIGSPHRHHIPFDFINAPKYRIDEDGLDYGLIHLGPLYVENLLANGVVPIGEESFEKNWPESFHGFAMIGTPQSTVSLKQHGHKSTLLSQTAYAVQLREEKNPPKVLITRYPRFFASILLPEDSDEWQAIGANITGMSGGPVIGIRKDGDQLKYWAIAIQSSWEAQRRTIAASYLQDFARFVGAELERVRK